MQCDDDALKVFEPDNCRWKLRPSKADMIGVISVAIFRSVHGHARSTQVSADGLIDWVENHMVWKYE